MKEKKIRSLKQIKIAGLAALAVAALSFGGTWAYYSGVAAIANPLKTSHSGAALVEEFNPDSSFLPGETVVKELKFVNTGEMDLFLRVEVPPEESWYNRKGEVQTDLLTSAVIKGWSDVWQGTNTSDGVKNDLTKWVESDEWSQTYRETDASGNARYYRYYKKILPVNGATAVILETIQLDPSVSNDRHDWDYSDKIYKLTFNAEAVPVEEQNGAIAVSSQWNDMSVTEADGLLTWTQGTAQNGAGNGN